MTESLEVLITPPDGARIYDIGETLPPCTDGQKHRMLLESPQARPGVMFILGKCDVCHVIKRWPKDPTQSVHKDGAPPEPPESRPAALVKATPDQKASAKDARINGAVTLHWWADAGDGQPDHQHRTSARKAFVEKHADVLRKVFSAQRNMELQKLYHMQA